MVEAKQEEAIRMNNKQAVTPITLVFWLIMFSIVFFMWGAQFMAYWANYAVQTNGLTGIEAFLLSNLLLWFLLILIIAILAYAYIGGNQ